MWDLSDNNQQCFVSIHYVSNCRGFLSAKPCSDRSFLEQGKIQEYFEVYFLILHLEKLVFHMRRTCFTVLQNCGAMHSRTLQSWALSFRTLSILNEMLICCGKPSQKRRIPKSKGPYFCTKYTTEIRLLGKKSTSD